MKTQADTPPKVRPPKGAPKDQSIREKFVREGRSIADFARSEGFDVHLVYQVIYGRVKGHRGQSHNIAIALGLKQGARTDKPAGYAKKQRETCPA